jgi:2-dehydro-3-deoxyphosphogluconate aldolase/(4S)-4-hydroxy-2-oxoglutarate aldolase
MRDLLIAHPIIPVIVIDNLEDAVPLAQALVAGGLNAIEVTLRTPAAISGIEQIIKYVPNVIVGSGTVCNEHQLSMSKDLGCKFAVSPGATDDLLSCAVRNEMPLLPGVSTASEIMRGLDYGYNTFKFFPAEASGGADTLKAFFGPFNNVRFCATGGIGLHNCRSYLSLENVLSVGGSWISTKKLINDKRWGEIELLAREAASISEKEF